MNFKDCSIQRNLDAEGRAQAGRIGDAFRKRGFKQRAPGIEPLLSRDRTPPRLTKLGPVTQQPVLNQVFLADIGGMREAGSQRPGRS